MAANGRKRQNVKDEQDEKKGGEDNNNSIRKALAQLDGLREALKTASDSVVPISVALYQCGYDQDRVRDLNNHVVEAFAFVEMFHSEMRSRLEQEANNRGSPSGTTRLVK